MNPIWCYSIVHVRLHYFKHSYHVLVTNYGCLPNMAVFHKQFVEIFLEKIKDIPMLMTRLGITGSHQEKINPIVDQSIYKKTQNFRCVGCTKPNKNSYFMPCEKDRTRPIHDFFIGWITEQDPPLDLSRLHPRIHLTQTKVEHRHDLSVFRGHSDLCPSPPPHLEDYIMRCLNLLSPERNNNYQTWFEVMCIVHSIHVGLLNVFDQWSQKSPSYESGCCERSWSKLYMSGYGLNHLLQLVMQDTGKGKDIPNFFSMVPKGESLNPKNLCGLTERDILKIVTDQRRSNSDYLQRLILNLQANRGALIDSLAHTKYGHRWKYVYERCPRDPLYESKKNNYWGATIRTNTTDRFIQINPLDIIKELGNMTDQFTTLVIKAPCGSAKSDFMVKVITLLTQLGHLPNKFLLLSALRTLAYSLQSRFMGDKKPYGWGESDPNPKEVDLKLYSEIKEYDDLIDQNINMVINSLPKLADFGNDTQLENYQQSLVVIDEFKSFLSNLCGGTLTGNRRKVVSHLEFYMQNAPLCVVMDQNIDDTCLQTLFQVRDPKKTLILDYQKTNCCEDTIYELHDMCKTLEILDTEYLSKNKVVYICCNAKTKGADLITEYIKKKYPNYQVSTYTSETDEAKKSAIGGCNEDWVITIICSPTITYGVDYSKEGVFSATFCFISKAYSIPANMIVQQMRRIRHTIDHKLFITDESTSYFESNTWESIDDQIIRRLTRNPKGVMPVEESETKECPHLKECLCDDGSNDPDSSDLKESSCLKNTPLIMNLKTNFEAKTKKLSNHELESMLIKSKLGTDGKPRLKKSWFATIYRHCFRNELESRQNMTHWIRGYFCECGFQYFVIDSESQQDPEKKDVIKADLEISEEMRLSRQVQKYLEAPIKQESSNSLSETKYYHCQIFGLKNVDEEFYRAWLDDQSHHKMANLINWLSSSSEQTQKQVEYHQIDYILTEKQITACRLLNQLLAVADLDLRGYFWTGLSPCQVEIGPILPHQTSFLNQNKKDLLYHFGGVARIQCRMETSYQLNKYVARIVASYLFAIELKCKQVQVRQDNQRIYQARYEIVINEELYELLSYRVIADRWKNMKWIFQNRFCDQLKKKFQSINKRWSHLAMYPDWSHVPTIEDTSTPEDQIPNDSEKNVIKPKIKLKLKVVTKTEKTEETDEDPNNLDHFKQCVL